jgi:hypothetical protein
MNNRLFLSFLFVLLYLTGCNSKSSEPQIKVEPSRATKIYSEAELNTLVTLGMSIAEVTNKFGLPSSAVKISENKILLNYLFAFEPKRHQGAYMIGFGIDIKDGHVVRWSPITGMTFNSTPEERVQGSPGEEPFQIFPSTDSETNLVSAVESKGSADASSLKGSPDLSFKAKVFVGNSGNERPGERTVILVLNNEDASKLKDLTEKNSGKRLLIVCRNKVIAAPVISVPLGSRQVKFTVKESVIINGSISNGP